MASLKAFLPVVTCYHNVVCPSVCMSSISLTHPAKSFGQDKLKRYKYLQIPSSLLFCPTGIQTGAL